MEIKHGEFHEQIWKLLTIIRLARDKDNNYVLDDESAKRTCTILLVSLVDFRFAPNNPEEYIEYMKNIEESINIL